MSIIREDSQVLLVKSETAYNTDSTPTGSNALEVFNIDISSEFSKKESEVMKGFLGANKSVTTAKHVKVKFDFYLTGSGTAGIAPPHAPVLLAGAMAEVVATGASVTYTPVQDNLDSATVYWRSGKLQHKVTGVRGTISTDFQNGDFRRATFDGFGFYHAPTVEAGEITGVDFSGLELPVAFANDTTTTCSFFGKNVQAKSISPSFGANFKFVDLVNHQEVELTDRNGSVTANFRVSDADYVDFVAKSENSTTGSLSLIVGTTTGNIVEVSIPVLSITDTPNISYEDGIGYLSVNASITPLTANSDYTLVFK